MNLELITYRTEDGLELDGAYYTAGRDGRTKAPLIIMTHGAWMNFYTGPQKFLPQYVVPEGFDCLAINNRDHDIGGIHPPTESCFGMIRCRFENIVPDLSGALAWGERQGYKKFILVCHSYSSQRVAYYLSQTQDQRIAALAMLSPPLGMQSAHKYWMDDWSAYTRKAAELVAEGKPDEILIERAATRFPVIASAQTITNLWSEINRMEDTDYMSDLTVPLLITRGEKEVMLVKNIQKIATAWKGSVTHATVLGSGHYYYENAEGLWQALSGWLKPFTEDKLNV